LGSFEIKLYKIRNSKYWTWKNTVHSTVHVNKVHNTAVHIK